MGHATAEPIAIIAMDCRFPGGANSPEEYWEILDSGRHFCVPLPQNRGWDLEWLNDPKSEATGSTCIRHGAFFDDISGFDAGFFGVSPREAVAMDPQQRLLLESTWTAIESARISPTALRGSRTGVYVGIGNYNYQSAGEPLHSAGQADVYLATGGAVSVASGRISYALDLRGPALSVDTACSSGLVAAHLAVRALRAGECDMAIAAGVCAMATPDVMVELGQAGALTGDGRCKAFAAEADGFAPSEGVATVVLMPLQRALETGRPVLAVVRGSAINHDGTGKGLTVPCSPAQQALIADALDDAALLAEQVDLVEAHGTGTRVGDPIEARSIQAAYASSHTPDRPVWIGSAKSNIGHTQAAAGLAGLIKVVLAMQHDTMPATLHAANPTPAVDWSPGTMRLLQQARDWPRGDRARRAGILAYGISGTNAHVILEEAPEPAPRPRRPRPRVRGPVAWPVSAASVLALREQSAALAAWTRQRPGACPADIGWSLATTRSALPERAAVVGEDTAALLAGLDALAGTGTVPASAGARAKARDSAGPVFIIPGQGAQWLGMGARLLEESPVFAKTLERCADALKPWIDFDVVDVVRGAPGHACLERSAVVQPALFAMYVSLAEIWRSHGVHPAAVIGHSQGEIAAAYIAGALTLKDAARAMAAHSQTLAGIVGAGAMVSLALPAQRTQELLKRWEDRLTVAVLNGPAATVVAGDTAAAIELLTYCEAEEILARRLPVDYASHSSHMDAVRESVLEILADLRPQPAPTPIISTVTGGLVKSAEMNADYWYRGMREPVLFETAVRHALNQGYRQFIEISPHPILTNSVREVAADLDIEANIVGTLHRDQGDTTDFTNALAAAHACGIDIDWSNLYPDAEEVDLPTTRFQRRSYWVPEKSRAADLTAAGLQSAGHAWLVATIDLPDGATVHIGRLRVTAEPWLADHAIYGIPMLPATGMVDLLLHGTDEPGCGRLEDVIFHTPLPLTDDVDIQVHAGTPDDAGRRPVSLHSRAQDPAASWVCHAEAFAVHDDDNEDAALVIAEAPQWPPDGARPADVADRYRALARRGYAYGPAFRNMTAAWHTDDGACYTELSLSDQRPSSSFTVHPALLDAALHGLLIGGNEANGEDIDRQILLPYTIASVKVFAPGAATLRATLLPAGPDRVNVHATDPSGRTVVAMDGLWLRQTTARALQAATNLGDTVTFQTVWRPVDPPDNPPQPEPERWGAVGSRSDLPVSQAHESMTDLTAALPPGGQAPEVVWLDCRGNGEPYPSLETDGLAAQVSDRLHRVLDDVQAFLAEPRLQNSRLVLLTRHAHSTRFGEAITDLPAAACAGMLRSAQKEHPGLLQLIDIDGDVPEPAVLAAAVATDRPQIALRGDRMLVQRLSRGRGDDPLDLPIDGAPWRLAPSASRTLEDVASVHASDLAGPVAAGSVRVRVDAAGVNFRDTLVCLGLVEGDSIGGEVAGTVVAVGSEVIGVAAGDRIIAFGIWMTGGYASMMDVDHRYVFPMPQGWTSAQAAGVFAVFVTAHHALYELADLQPGEKVLIHAAAGGVGMAAVQLARARDADIYATASLPKHDLLAAMGIPPAHIADSRSLDFEPQLRQATSGDGFDVILGSLTGQFVDASLRLLRPGGRYLEMGMRDIRDPEEIRTQYPGIAYRTFDLIHHPPEALQREFGTLIPLFEQGTLQPLPTDRWNVRYARQALRRLSQGHTTGKTILTRPIELDPNGTVLITGGTGTLGAQLAKHLAAAHRVRHLLLLSRHGAQAPGADELEKELVRLGAAVAFAACDAADRTSLADAIAAVPAAHPLTAVVHAAATLDDGLFTDMTPERLNTVLRAKVHAALNLHELTRDMDLQAFVLYSSIAGVVGTSGQSNYAAANSFLDALAHHRRRLGLPAISISWGWWRQTSELTAQMRATDRVRMAHLGFVPIPTSQALAGFDTALDLDQPHLAVTAIPPLSAGETVSDLLADLPRQRTRRASGSDNADGSQETADRAALLAQPAGSRLSALTALICTHAATILGHASSDDVPADQTFRQTGFDSLASVELRTRLNTATGTRLTATAIYDHPTPEALARHINTLLTGSAEPNDENNHDAAGNPMKSFAATVSKTWRSGDREKALRLVEEAAAHRPTTHDNLPAPAWRLLTKTSAPRKIVCVPPVGAAPAYSPYDRLAPELEGTGELWTALLPGYLDEEPLPANLSHLMNVWASSLPGDPAMPIYFLGHSSGGLLAHTLASTLQERNTPVHGVILLDSAGIEAVPAPVRDEAIDRFIRASVSSLVSGATLSAAQAYTDLLSNWTPKPLDVPTLFVHPHNSRLNEIWPQQHDACAVPGTHMSMLEEHAARTAQAICRWLEQANPNQRRTGTPPAHVRTRGRRDAGCAS